MKLCNDKSMTGMLFADDFVGVSDSRENLQKLIDVVHNYCNTVGAKKKLTLRFRCTEQKGTKLRRSRNETIKRKHETKRKSSKTKRNYIARAARDCANRAIAVCE